MNKKNISIVLLPNPQLSNPMMYMNLGLLYISASLKQAGHYVRCIDLRDSNNITDTDIQKMLPCDYALFSATSGEIEYAKDINLRLKLISPSNIKTVIGGAHASLLPADCRMFDITVIGEGEIILSQIIDSDITGKFRAGRIKNLDFLPFPDWELLPPEKMFSYSLMPGEKYGTAQEKAMTVMNSRGCPFKCSFCANVHVDKVIYRSPKNIYEEVKLLKEKYNVSQIRFEDDNFTLKKSWLKELSLLLKTLDIRYKCHTRADVLTEDDAQKAYNSGCIEMAIGVESADPIVLNKINKQETIDQYIRAIKIIKDAGMLAKIYLISGLPGETDKSLDHLYDFLSITQPDKWTISQFTPYPGSDIWRYPKKYGIFIDEKAFSFYWNFPEKVVYSFEDGTSSAKLKERYDMAYLILKEEQWRNNDYNKSKTGGIERNE